MDRLQHGTRAWVPITSVHLCCRLERHVERSHSGWRAERDLCFSTSSPTFRGRNMAINFNHTILSARDSKASADFLAEMLGLPAPRRWGPFQMVTTDNDATKFLAADACALEGRAVVHGSGVRWRATVLGVRP